MFDFILLILLIIIILNMNLRQPQGRSCSRNSQKINHTRNRTELNAVAICGKSTNTKTEIKNNTSGVFLHSQKTIFL